MKKTRNFIEAIYNGEEYEAPKVDDDSEFLPKGSRRSERFIARREAREAAERADKKQRKEDARRYAENREINDDHPNESDIKHNTPQPSRHEMWLDGGGAVIVMGIITIAIMLFVAYYVSHADPSSWIFQPR